MRRRVSFAQRLFDLVLDAAGDAVTLVETGKVTRFPIVLVGSEYWGGLLTWLREKVQAEGKIRASELDLITVADDPAEVVEIITKAHAQDSVSTPRPDVNGT